MIFRKASEVFQYKNINYWIKNVSKLICTSKIYYYKT